VASPRFTLLSIHDGGADEALRIAHEHRILIGFDLGLEINATFIANADRTLLHDDADAMVCSCQDEETNSLRLPFGSAGGIAILSEEVSAGVWAINLQKMKEFMESVSIVEEGQNLLCSAREFGENLLRRICVAGGKVALDTNVGAIAVNSAKHVARNTHTWYRRTLKLIDDIGLNSFAGISLPTWQIVSVAAQKRAQASFDRENAPALIAQAVGAEYPRVAGGAPHEIMAKRAAFFGDLAQGIQILAANGPVESKAQMDLIGTALAERLRSKPFQFQALDSWPGLFTLDVNSSYGFVPTPTGFILHPNHSGAKPATVIVTAVPLQRYHALEFGLRLPDEGAVTEVKLSVAVFEELGGHEIARREFIVVSQAWQQVALPLPPIAGSAVFQFVAELASSRPVADHCALELSDFKFQRSIQ
jgi:hypothetical protein